MRDYDQSYTALQVTWIQAVENLNGIPRKFSSEPSQCLLLVNEWLVGLKPINLVGLVLCREDYPQQPQNYVATSGAKSMLERSVCIHTWKEVFLSHDWVFRHRDRHCQCLFSFSEEEETNRTLSEMKKYWKKGKCFFFLKRPSSIQKMSLNKGFQLVSYLKLIQNIVSRRRTLSLVALPQCHFWLFPRVRETVSIRRVNHLCCVQSCLVYCIQTSPGTVFQFACFSVLKALAKIRNSMSAMCIYSALWQNKSRWK